MYIRTFEIGADHKYKVEDRYIDGNRLQMSGHYSSLDDSDGIRDGHFVFYTDSGFIDCEGNYLNDSVIGEWRYYSNNSQLLWYTINYNNGARAELTSYYKNGKIKRKEFHDKNDKVISGKCYDEVGNEIAFTQFEIMPKAPYDLIQFLVDNMHYPKKARKQNITGRVVTKFVVDESGHIIDVEVVEHVSPELDAEAVRVISKMPPWSPGVRDDKAVKVYFTQPITFNLE